MKILLKQEGNDLPIATMEVGEVFTPNKPLETLKCYGTSQLEHPGESVANKYVGERGHVCCAALLYRQWLECFCLLRLSLLSGNPSPPLLALPSFDFVLHHECC